MVYRCEQIGVAIMVNITQIAKTNNLRKLHFMFNRKFAVNEKLLPEEEEKGIFIKNYIEGRCTVMWSEFPWPIS